LIYGDLARTNSLVKIYKHLHFLSRLPWWTRLWVIQEYVQSTSVLFVYGEQHIREDAMVLSTMLALGLRNHFKTLISYENNQLRTTANIPLVSPRLIMMLIFGFEDWVFNLAELMVLLYLFGEPNYRQSTDPRDKVFALIGLANSTMSIEADYSKSVEEVYTQASATFLSSGDAHLLSIPRPDRSLLKVRSWVTDWTALSAPNLGSWLLFQASNSKKSRSKTHALSGGFVDVLGLEGTNVCSVDEPGYRYTEIFKLADKLT